VSENAATASSSREITVTINGTVYEREVEARKLLIHFIRDDVDLTGSHIGCDTGNCGACSVIVDGTLVKSCMILAVQADGSSIETVEGLADGDELAPLQQAFSDEHALQCGYCTPGMLMSATALLRTNPNPTEDEIKKGLQGNICRCTGYWNIFEAVASAAERMQK
jgi:aerobic-type carbon monoxide dehydrogenase small subunit (CoxS/CutS family)